MRRTKLQVQTLPEQVQSRLMKLPVPHNPFSTRYTHPGAVPFMMPPGETLESVADRFRRQKFVGQIVGHHGAGKTTFCHSLERLLRKDFGAIRRITIRHPRDVLAKLSGQAMQSNSDSRLLVVDGLERLPWLHRRLLLKQVQYPELGLLVTTHRALVGIPVLYTICPTIDTLRELTNQLAPGLAIKDQVLASVHQKNPENIRESLMSLYDWFEKRDP